MLNRMGNYWFSSYRQHLTKTCHFLLKTLSSLTFQYPDSLDFSHYFTCWCFPLFFSFLLSFPRLISTSSCSLSALILLEICLGLWLLIEFIDDNSQCITPSHIGFPNSKPIYSATFSTSLLCCLIANQSIKQTIFYLNSHPSSPTYFTHILTTLVDND